MNKFNKKDLFEQVAEEAKLSKKEAKAIIEKVFDVIQRGLLLGEEVNITNFGVLTPKTRVERIGTHPKTHEIMTIKGGTTIVFRPAKSFKAKLN